MDAANQETPPEGLSAAQLRAWKRKQKILKNSENRMSLVSGQMSNVKAQQQQPVPSSEPTTTNEVAQVVEEVKPGESIDEKIEDLANEIVEETRQDQTSVKEDVEQEETSGEVKEKPKGDDIPKWQKRWAQRSAAGLSSEQVDEIMNRKPESKPVKEINEDGLRRRKGVDVDSSESSTAISDKPKQKETMNTSENSILKQLKLQSRMAFVRKGYKWLHLLLIIMFASITGYSWGIKIKEAQWYPVLDDSVSEAKRIQYEASFNADIHEDTLLDDLSLSIPITLLSESLFFTTFVFNFAYKICTIVFWKLFIGDLQSLFVSNNQSMIAKAIGLLSMVLGAQHVTKLQLLTEFLSISKGTIEDIFTIICVIFVTGAATSLAI